MGRVVAIVVLLSCGEPTPRWESAAVVPGPAFRLVGTSMGNVQAVVGDGTAASRRFVVEVAPNAAALSGRAPGRPLFVQLEVHASIDGASGWIALREDGTDEDPVQGNGEVTSRIRSCTDAARSCARRFSVTISFPGAAAGQEGQVSWQVRSSVSGSGTAQPPAGAALATTVSAWGG